MTGVAEPQAPLEAVLKDEIIRMYQEVADQPEGTFHFYHSREAAPTRGPSSHRGSILRDVAPAHLDTSCRPS
jgi:hypothetical protein